MAFWNGAVFGYGNITHAGTCLNLTPSLQATEYADESTGRDRNNRTILNESSVQRNGAKLSAEITAGINSAVAYSEFYGNGPLPPHIQRPQFTHVCSPPDVTPDIN